MPIRPGKTMLYHKKKKKKKEEKGINEKHRLSKTATDTLQGWDGTLEEMKNIYMRVYLFAQ